MTEAATVPREEYTGNGVTTVFAFDHNMMESSEIKVYVDQTLKSLTTHYTVSGDFPGATHSVTFLVAPASDEDIVILRDTPKSQAADLINSGGSFMSVLEKAVDKVTRIVQDMASQLSMFTSLSLFAGTGLVRKTGATSWTVGTSVTTAELGNSSVTLAKMAVLAAATLIGSVGGGTPAALSVDQVRQLLSVYSINDITALFSEIDSAEFNYRIPAQFGPIGTADDTATLQLAMDSSLPLFLPKGTTYIVDGLTSPSNKVIFGPGKLKLKEGSTNSVLDLQTSTKVRISGIEIEGNSQTDTGDTGSSGIVSDSGAADILISKCYIHHCARHGIALDADDIIIDRNRVEDTRWGAGILTGVTEYATNVSVLHNTVLRTQQGNIQSYFGVRGWRVLGNHCDETNAGVGSGGGGEIADNVTSYTEDASGGLQDATVIGNICKNSGNHGMHIGGDRVTISGNDILDPLNAGIFAAKGDNTTPDPASTLSISGNVIKYITNAGSTPRGIIIRNMKNFSVITNVVDGSQVGIELNGIDTAGDGVFLGSIVGNTFTMYDTYGVWLRNKVKGVTISYNTLQADVSSSTQDIREDFVSAADTDNSIHSNFTIDADTEYGQMLRAQGSSVIAIGNANGEHLRVGSTTVDVVNGWTAAGNITGSAPLLATRGVDTDIDAVIAPKGDGNLRVPIANVPDFADDAAASAGGVSVGGFYRNGSVLMIRAA